MALKFKQITVHLLDVIRNRNWMLLLEIMKINNNVTFKAIKILGSWQVHAVAKVIMVAFI